jgi:uroporphyrinogen decarboxylase
MQDLLTETMRGPVAPSSAEDEARTAKGSPAGGPTPNRRERMLKALRCQPADRPPMWLMRQAGRCLPEYRAIKEKYTFRELIQSPELAAEVTLQPIRRFGFDAAILCSDILVIPEALGQGFSFRDQGGVKMDSAVKTVDDIKKLQPAGVSERLRYVADALDLIKSQLNGRTALFGFAGSPWTLANFMLEGGSARNFVKARELFTSDRAAYDLLAEKLTGAVTEFLQMQIAHGVDAIQIFDSVGGLLPLDEFEAASGRWMREIVSGLEGRVPVIVYSKGTRAWSSLLGTGAQVIGVDQGIALAEAVREIPAGVAVQGNLDPALLTDVEPAVVVRETTRMLDEMRGRDGYIFNLGHGVPPDAKMANLEALVQTVTNFV